MGPGRTRIWEEAGPGRSLRRAGWRVARLALGSLDMSLQPLSSKERRESSWRVVEGQTLKWRCWSGDYAVFNPLSGQTHFLDIVTGKIVVLLISGSHSIVEMRASISKFLDLPNDDKLAATIADILMRLEDVGLVEHLD